MSTRRHGTGRHEERVAGPCWGRSPEAEPLSTLIGYLLMKVKSTLFYVNINVKWIFMNVFNTDHRKSSCCKSNS